MASRIIDHGYLSSELPSSSADSQPRAADQLKDRHDLSSNTVFRLHILGKRNWDKSQIDESKVEQLVRKAFDVTPDAKIIVKSLADHPVRQALVATLNFSQIPTKISQTSPSLQEFDGTVEDLSLDLDTHFHGFTPLHSSTSSEYTSDLIALSGLGSHAFGSFKRRGGDFMWLRDDLPISIPNARVFIYGYDTGLQDSASFQSLEDLGLSFKDALRSLLKENWKSGFLKPLVLLAHSLGGLVVKEALCQTFTDLKVDEELLLKSIRAILFFGTPNQGMDITSLIPMVAEQPNEDFVRSLSTDSADLRRQAQQWSKAFDSAKPRFISDKLEITSYYETSASRTAIKVGDKWEMSGPPAKLVDRSSATHGRPWERDERFIQPIDRDHSGLVKYRSRNDPVYVNHVLPRLQTYLYENGHKRQKLNFTDEQNGCLSSLNFPERTSRQDEIVTARDTTCEWLLEHQNYKSWLQGSQGLLWLEGHPGTGKSTLTKHAVEAMSNGPLSNRNVVFTHFFHGRGSEMQKTALGFLRSLACQLLKSVSVDWNEIASKYKESDHQPIWKLEWLGSFLQKQLRQACTAQRIIIFIDALDECEEEGRDYLRDFLTSTVRGSVGTTLKIFVSCRHYPNLFSEGSKILTAINNTDDIAVFVTSNLQIMQEKKRSVLANEIINNARGNFQWAKIVTIESVKLHRKGRTAAEIEEKIRALPKDIHELYESLFKDADPDDLRLAHRLFHWLCFAKRPLQICELQYAIMLSPETKERSISEVYHRTDFRKDLDDMINTIINISRGLAEIIPERKDISSMSSYMTFSFMSYPHFPLEDEVPSVDKSRIRSLDDEIFSNPSWSSKVQLIHQTVRDYLLDIGLPTVEGTRYRFSMGQSSYFITRSCLRYITMEDFSNKARRPREIKNRDDIAIDRHALCTYISESMESNLRYVDAEGIDQSDFTVNLGWPFCKGHLMKFSVALHTEPFIEQYLDGVSRFELRSAQSLLHWSAQKGISGIVKSIVKRKFGQPQGEDCPGGASISTLALDISTREMQNIFPNGYFDVNLRVGETTALLLAVQRQHTSAVYELMQSPFIDPNVKDERGRTPLHYANGRSSGNRQVVKSLLEHPSIDITLQDCSGRTPLSEAVRQTDIEIVRMNFDAARACVDIGDSFWGAPLWDAAMEGNTYAVKLLIDSDYCTREHLQFAYNAARSWQRIGAVSRKECRKECLKLLTQTDLVDATEENDDCFISSGVSVAAATQGDDRRQFPNIYLKNSNSNPISPEATLLSKWTIF